MTISDIRDLGDGRAVCELATTDGMRIVGLYAVDDGAITAACHYFSDVATLDQIGVLPKPSPDAGAAAPQHQLGTTPADGAAVLSDLLGASRRAHRRHRLRLVIHALDERVHAARGATGIPRALTAAIRDYQRELASLEDVPQAGPNGAGTPRDSDEPRS